MFQGVYVLPRSPNPLVSFLEDSNFDEVSKKKTHALSGQGITYSSDIDRSKGKGVAGSNWYLCFSHR